MDHSWQYGYANKPPSPANVQARAYLLDVMQRGLPGYPTDDRYLQSQKFTGLVYTAVRPLMRAIRRADVVALKRVRRRRNRTTFGPGGIVAKSLSAGYGKSQRDDYVPIDQDHPVARVLDRPQQEDGTESIGDILEYATLQACLTGVSPVWCVPSEKYIERGDWRPVQLYALPTALTVPQPGSAGLEYPSGLYRLTPYYATPTGGGGYFAGRAGSVAGTILDGREVKRRMYKHPLYRWDGYSPLTACAFLLDIAESIDQARWSAMNSGVNPDVILKMAGADEATALAVKAKILERNGGSRKNREPMMLWSPNTEAEFDVEFGNRSPKEMDFKDSWEQATAAVLAVFGTPRTVAGLSTASGHAELYAAKKQFHEMSVEPECEELGEFLTVAVAQPWEEEPGEICIEVLAEAPKNEDTSIIAAKDRVSLGIVTVNESRASQNLPPLPGGDVPLQVFTAKAGISAGTTPDPNKPPAPPPGAPGKPEGEGPTAGAPPTPDNPEGKGTRPPTGPVAKSMSTLDMTAGGALVPPATVGGGRKLGRRRSKRVLDRMTRGKA
jgi:hypothetical protein